MSLRAPKLDDRSFHELVAEAKRLVRERCPGWTDLSPGDPGTTLLEVYAFLTEVMLYRINRLPEKAYIEFLRLMGVKLAPPSAARVALEFRRSEGTKRRIEVPRGTRTTVARSNEGEEPPIFTTAESVVLEPDQDSISVIAYHCRLVHGEELGVSGGLPGQSYQLRQAPVVAPTGDDLDLVVAVEAAEDEVDERVPSLAHDGVPFRIWREVERFGQSGEDNHAYIVDRTTGTISFAPAVRSADPDAGNGLERNARALAAVPPADRRICAWYRCGGGPTGNVAAHTLTVLKDPIPGLKVDNPQAAVGGCEVESVDNALTRGPQDLHSLNRAVTARDYESVALREGSVGRAHAVAMAERWQFATPGTVQLMLVPDVARTTSPPYSRESLENAQTDEALNRVRQAIDERRPLGTHCLVDWYRYKSIRVHARLVLHPEEDPGPVRARVIRRLGEMINPLGGHSLRRLLHASDVYHTVLNEPGVLYADHVRFSVAHAPNSDVEAIAADPHHAGLWYAAAADQVFRSMDNGTGWELLTRFSDEKIVRLVCCDYSPGLIVAISHHTIGEEKHGSRVRLSHDCGRLWRDAHELGFQINDAAWIRRGGEPVLLLATDQGLFQVPPGAGPVPVLVDEDHQGLGFYSIATVEAPRLGTQIAVAARTAKGVYLCPDDQLQNFTHIGLDGSDVRVLATQRVGPRAFVWAGLAAVGGDHGEGCLRRELRRDVESSKGWVAMSEGWRGGSCRAIACNGEQVFAATFHSGVVSIDSSARKPVWRVPGIDCGLALRDEERLLHRINDVAVNRTSEGNLKLLCSSAFGVFSSDDSGQMFRPTSALEFAERVTIGEGFLFCSDDHDIEAVHDATP